MGKLERILTKTNLSIRSFHFMLEDEYLNISYPNLYNIVKGKTPNITLKTIKSICKTLECTPNDIIDYEDW